MSSRFVRKKPAPKGRDGRTVALEIARKSPTPPTSQRATRSPPQTPTKAPKPSTSAAEVQVTPAEDGQPLDPTKATPPATDASKEVVEAMEIEPATQGVPSNQEPTVEDMDEGLEHSSAQPQATTGQPELQDQPPLGSPSAQEEVADDSSNEEASEDEEDTSGEKLTADVVRDQIQGLKALHSTWTDSVETFTASRTAGTPAVMGEIKKIRKTLREIEYSLEQKRLELEDLTSNQQEEIIFCGEIVRGPTLKIEEKEKAKLPNFKRLPGRKSNAKARSDVSRLIDDEAVECNKFEGAAPTLKKKKRPVLSTEFVDLEDLEEEAKEKARKEKVAETVKPASTTVLIEDEVKKGRKRKEAEKRPKKVVDKESPFYKTKIDLRTLITDLTPAELGDLKRFEESIPTAQFNWGSALAQPVAKIIQTWNYDETSEEDKVKSKDITPILTFLKDVNNNKTMLTRLQTAPRLMQLSSDDPYFDVKSFNWPLLVQSADFDWDEKNGFFRALHGMSCRTSDSCDWTEDKGLLKQLIAGYKILQSMLDEALRHVSFDTRHKDHVLKYDNAEDCPTDLVSITGAIAWLYQQVVMNKRPGEADPKSNVKGPGLAHLQAKYFEVMMGVTLVYEWDIMNRTVQEMVEAGRSAKEVAAVKKLQKEESCLREIVKKHLRKDVTQPQAIEAGPSQTNLVNQALVKVQQAEVIKNERQALSDIRKDALQSLSVFLMYGTAGLIHLWPVAHDQVMHDGCYMIKTAAIFAGRFSSKGVHVYGERAWNRLDNNVFKCLKDYITPGGRFRKNITWEEMVSSYFKNFKIDILSHMYVLDMGSEVLMPRTSRGLDGSICHHVAFTELAKMRITAPDFEPVRQVFTATQDQRLRLGEGGDGMYSDMVLNGSVKRPLNDVTVLQRDRKKARVEVENRRQSKSVVHTNSDDEVEDAPDSPAAAGGQDKNAGDDVMNVDAQ